MFWRHLLSSPLAFCIDIPIPVTVTRDGLDDVELTDRPHSFGDYAGQRLVLEEVDSFLSILQNNATVDAVIRQGHQATAQIFTEASAFLFHRATRIEDQEEAAENLHRSSRLLEVILPRSHLKHREFVFSLYERSARRLHESVFASQPRPMRTAADQSHTIFIAVVALGRSFGEAAKATFNSILWHATCRIHVYVIGDRGGWEGFTASVNTSALTVEFVDPRVNERYNQIFGVLPKTCRGDHGFRELDHPDRVHALTTKVFLHELLPEVEQIIVLDVGDLIVLDDICSLWGTFDHFGPHALFAAAMETGPEQVTYGPQSGDDTADFWGERGLPGQGKGVNSGVMLMDLGRMRNGTQRGVTWTVNMLDFARQVCQHWCGFETLREQSLLSAWIFSGGVMYWKELPSRWNYIPSIPWELASNNAQIAGLPGPVLGMKMHPGLRPGGRMVHACPFFAEVVAEWSWSEPVERRSWSIAEAQKYMYWFNTMGAPGFFTKDTTCGQSIKAVHLVGFTKFLPWARKMVQYWAEGPAPGGFFEVFD